MAWIDSNNLVSLLNINSQEYKLKDAEARAAIDILNSDATVDVEKGYSISEPENDPTWTGYRFDGWYNNEQCIGSPYSFDSAVNDSFTLYAKWVKRVTITYVLYDEVTDPVELDFNDKIEQPADPVRAGYAFDGWYADPDGSGENNHWTFGYSAQTNETIYAHWIQKEPVNVTFDTNGGTTATFNQEVAYNGLAAVPEIPVYENHTFLGWYKDPEGTKEFDFTTPVAADVTLYAKWSEEEGQG